MPKMTKFTLLFVSSSPKITWSTWKHKNEGSVTPPGHFGSQFVLGAASIVEISLDLSAFSAVLDSQSPLADFFHILVESPIDFLITDKLWIRQFITLHGYFNVFLKHCILDLEKMEGKSSKVS